MRINNSVENEQLLQVVNTGNKQKIEYLVNMNKVIQFTDNQGEIC